MMIRLPKTIERWTLVAWTIGLLANSLTAEDWPRFRGPNHDGKSTEMSWSHDWGPEGPPVAWVAQVGIGFSSCAVSGNHLVTIGNREDTDRIVCFQADSGDLIWSHSYRSATDANEFEGGPTATPTIDGRHVFTVGRHGDLLALDLQDGNEQWRVDIGDQTDLPIPAWGIAGSPLVDDQRLILNIGDAGAAFDKSNGSLIWKSEARECGYSSPLPFVINGQKSIVFGSGRSYVGVDSLTGRLQWRQRWLTTFGCNAADPVVSGDRLFLCSGYNRGGALFEFPDGEPQLVWKHKSIQNQLATSVLIDGHLYGAHGDVASGASLICVELASGRVCWEQQDIRVGAISAAGNRLLVIQDDGRLEIVAANDQEFERLASHQVFNAKCWTAPVLANGLIYCRSAVGDLVCLNVAAE